MVLCYRWTSFRFILALAADFRVPIAVILLTADAGTAAAACCDVSISSLRKSHNDLLFHSLVCFDVAALQNIVLRLGELASLPLNKGLTRRVASSLRTASANSTAAINRYAMEPVVAEADRPGGSSKQN